METITTTMEWFLLLLCLGGMSMEIGSSTNTLSRISTSSMDFQTTIFF
jgi:hypothetical protein